MNKEKIIVLETNNTWKVEEVSQDLPLKELQEIVGGYIERVVPTLGHKTNLLPRDVCFLIDEEGKFKDYGPNNIATLLYGSTHDTIVGRTILYKNYFNEKTHEEEFQGFKDEEIESIKKILDLVMKSVNKVL